jgi:trehalose 6-phosphate phosphatase
MFTQRLTEMEVTEIPSWLWERARATPRLLALAYDGVLSGVSGSSSAAAPSRRALLQLRRIASSQRTMLAIVSARPVDQILSLVRPLQAWIVGEHGWEIRSPEGDIILQPLDEASRHALDDAARVADELGWATRLERSPIHVALSLEGLHPKEARELTLACERAWRAPAAASGLSLVAADQRLEVRAPGYDPGCALRDLMAMSCFGAIAVYLGAAPDDEDGFEAVRDAGLGIRVGEEERRSLAVGRLGTPEDVAWFLGAWLTRVEGWSMREASTPM